MSLRVPAHMPTSTVSSPLISSYLIDISVLQQHLHRPREPDSCGPGERSPSSIVREVHKGEVL